MEITRLKLSALELNSGQIDGLPANPRQWTRDDVDRIARSLKETPELFEMRPCIVTPHGKKYVILAGSLRYCGAKKNGDADVPAIIFVGTVEKMKEIVLKDNGSFGAWDMDALGNEWDDMPLADWGVPAYFAPMDEGESSGSGGSGDHTDLSGECHELYQIAIDCEDEEEQERIYNELKDKYKCRVLTL